MVTPAPGEPAPPLAPAPAPPGASTRQRRTVGSAVALGILIAICALATIGVVLYFGTQYGPLAIAIGLGGAILPVPFLVGCFLWLDRYQPAPPWLVLLCFFWGAGAAANIALQLNRLAAKGLPTDIVVTMTGPATEETFKALLPLLLFWFYRRAYSGVVDGIVYCGLSAVGFAMVENILYLGGNAFSGASDNGFAVGALAAYGTFLVRVPLSGFAHPLFTSLTGIALGIAARSANKAVRVLAPLAGLLLATVLHATWNLMALLSQDEPFLILYGYFAFFVPLFFVIVGTILWIRSREGRLAERMLPAYAMAGWFSPPEVVALSTLGRRLSARKWAARVAGQAGESAMKAYQFAATRLAVLRDGLDRGLYRKPQELDRALAEERELLQTIDSQRQVFVGRDPLTPWAFWSGTGYQIQFPDGAVRSVPPPPSPVLPVPVGAPPTWAPTPMPPAPDAAWRPEGHR